MPSLENLTLETALERAAALSDGTIQGKTTPNERRRQSAFCRAITTLEDAARDFAPPGSKSNAEIEVKALKRSCAFEITHPPARRLPSGAEHGRRAILQKIGVKTI